MYPRVIASTVPDVTELTYIFSVPIVMTSPATKPVVESIVTEVAVADKLPPMSTAFAFLIISVSSQIPAVTFGVEDLIVTFKSVPAVPTQVKGPLSAVGIEKSTAVLF